MRLRVKTTGILETSWQEGPISYKLCDVGGAKSERRKWIHCLGDVHQTIFVVNLCSILWPHPEDNDSLETWEALHGVKFLKKFALVFNKWDLFEKFMKLDQFQEFKSKFGAGLCDVVSCGRFIALEFLKCLKDEKVKVIFTSFVSEDFESCREHLLDPDGFEEKEKVRMMFPSGVPTWEKQIRLLYLGHRDIASPLSGLPIEIIKSIHHHLF
uniref:Uncharacterized protein n=1 Tax=Arcella intermedia TaxID=1963864 RepID=A0A6B2LIB2_9EUKA